MPMLTVECPHTLSGAEAAGRLKATIAAALEQYQAHLADLEQTWHGDTLTFACTAAGMKVSGTLEALDAVVRLAADMPWAAMIFKKVIQERIRAELARALT